MKVSEAIDQLKVGDEVWVKGKVEYITKLGALPLALEFSETTKYFAESDEISLTEPKNEKVEIPQFLADYFNNNPNLGISGLLDFEMLECDDEYDVSNWLYGNDITENNKRYLIACKAYLEGYTVEQPKRWVVKIGDYHSTYIESLTIIPKLRYTLSEQEGAYKFTDKAQAEAVATLVEGSVEEVAD